MSPMPFEDKICSSFIEAVKLCLKLREEDLSWSFRGQRNKEWNLKPHVINPCDLDRCLEQFKKRTMEVGHPRHVPEDNEWRWLYHARHHGLKTRLLDWTTNPLVAIYFAVENINSQYKDDSKCGAVWALKVNPDNFRDPEDPGCEQKPADVKDWFMVNPLPVTPRLARQSGKFTYHPKLEGLDLTRRRPKEELVKITFREKGKQTALDIRKQLGILNVHHAALFPDHDGIARFVDQEWVNIA